VTGPYRQRWSLDNLLDLPLRRIDHVSLIPRCWQLRDSMTVYEACYVASAEMLDAELLAADANLAKRVALGGA
jgi:predicted nucleic acid-binding protein